MLGQPWNAQPVRIVEARLQGFLLCVRINARKRFRSCGSSDRAFKHEFLLGHLWRLNKSFSSQYGLISTKYTGSFLKVMNRSDRIRQRVSVLFVQLVFAVLLVSSISVAVTETSSCKFNF